MGTRGEATETLAECIRRSRLTGPAAAAVVLTSGGADSAEGAAGGAPTAARGRLRARTGSEWVVTGHTRTDLAETVLYRLATSPGRRALLGLRPRRGAVVRPLLALGREQG